MYMAAGEAAELGYCAKAIYRAGGALDNWHVYVEIRNIIAEMHYICALHPVGIRGGRAGRAGGQPSRQSAYE